MLRVLEIMVLLPQRHPEALTPSPLKHTRHPHPPRHPELVSPSVTVVPGSICCF